MKLTPCVPILILTMATGLTGCAVTPATRTAAAGECFAEFSGDGAWCWFADPRAVVRDGKTFAGWVSTHGSIMVGALDNKTGDMQTAILHPFYQRDDHDNPALLFLPDGRLMAFYSKHGGPEMNARVTIRPGDISDWNTETTISFAPASRKPKNVTYPNPVLLTNESNAIYLFWRGDDWKPTFSKSTDSGVTWQTQKEIVRRPGSNSSNRPYVKVASDGHSRIHLIFTDGHPRNEASNSVYYACYHDGAFFKADGSRIAGMDELPFTPGQADCIYDATKTGVRAWVWDLALDKSGRPVIAYTRLPAETDHRYHYAAWDGKAWQDHEITAAGRWFPETARGKTESEPHYSGGIALDPLDPSVVFLSRQVTNVFEIEQWATKDLGATWRSEAVTAGSKFNNVRPVVVRGHDASSPGVLWMNNQGGYSHYTSYRTRIKSDRAAKTQPAGMKLPPLSPAIERAAVLTAMERVGDWQIANHGKHKLTDWTQGALFTGIMALDTLSPSPRFREEMARIGEFNEWKLGPRVYHADDYVVGQTYAELFLRHRNDRMIAPMKAAFDGILAKPITLPIDHERKNGEDQWSWCDSLFMGPPAWIRLATATGDQRYYHFAVSNWWATSEHLYDTGEHLYFRDNSFFKKREANGAKIFWSRGNGWVMGGLVRMMQFIPKDSPDRARFEKQFVEMSEKILSLQQPDGLWRASLLDSGSYPLKETSGSGFYTYALAWGINEGLLDRAKFEPGVRRAWTALVECVTPEGRLTHVQPIGADPRQFDPNATEVYGVGAFLLAGSEVWRLAK